MKAIIACDDKGGIGLNGSMPWSRLNGDLARFKALTSNSAVIMGKGTWDATDMPSPLPNRLNVVVSKSKLVVPANTLHITSIDYLDAFNRDSWIIGGARLLESTMHLITHIHLTRVPGDYKCDTVIDLNIIETEFSCIKVEKYSDHTYEMWVRTRASVNPYQ